MTPRDRVRIQTLTARISQRLQAMNGMQAGPASTAPVDAAFSVIHDYELLAREIYRLRARKESGQAQDPLIARTEDFLSNLAQDLVHLSRNSKGRTSVYGEFINRYRRLWRENFSLFIFTAAVFTGSLFMGWNLGRYQQDYVPLIVGQAMMETVLDQTPWFERLNDERVLGMVSIAINNIRVTLMVFVLGALGGIGGLGLLIFNGLSIGALMGYCAAHGFDDRLTEFVLSHGFLELTVIVAGAFASFLIGRSFYLRPFSQLRLHLALGAKEGFTIAMGVAPWLVLAAFFEAFISPNPLIAFKTKLAWGLVIGGLFWLWTFLPVRNAE